MAAREELARTDLTRMLHRTPTAPAETLKTLNPEQYRALRAMGTGEKARAAETPAAGIAKRVFSMIGKPSPVGAPVAPSRARDHESSSSDSESSSSERPSPRSAGTRRPANPAAPAAVRGADALALLDSLAPDDNNWLEDLDIDGLQAVAAEPSDSLGSPPRDEEEEQEEAPVPVLEPVVVPDVPAALALLRAHTFLLPRLLAHGKLPPAVYATAQRASVPRAVRAPEARLYMDDADTQAVFINEKPDTAFLVHAAVLPPDVADVRRFVSTLWDPVEAQRPLLGLPPPVESDAMDLEEPPAPAPPSRPVQRKNSAPTPVDAMEVAEEAPAPAPARPRKRKTSDAGQPPSPAKRPRAEEPAPEKREAEDGHRSRARSKKAEPTPILPRAGGGQARTVAAQPWLAEGTPLPEPVVLMANAKGSREVVLVRTPALQRVLEKALFFFQGAADRHTLKFLSLDRNDRVSTLYEQLRALPPLETTDQVTDEAVEALVKGLVSGDSKKNSSATVQKLRLSFDAACAFLTYFVVVRHGTMPSAPTVPYLNDALYGAAARYRPGSAVQKQGANARAGADPTLATSTSGVDFARVLGLRTALNALLDDESDDNASEPAEGGRGPEPVPVSVPAEGVQKAQLIRLVAANASKSPFMKEFQREHARFFYDMYAVPGPYDAQQIGTKFFEKFKQVANLGVTTGQMMTAPSILFWVMLAHVVAACFLPPGTEPYRGDTLFTDFPDLF